LGEILEYIDELPSTRKLRVVVASPGDTQLERDALTTVIAEVNKTLADFGRQIVLTLSRWETDVHPALHADGPQGVIDSILKIEDCDILIGIFWKRFGQPYRDAGSNTEHEIQRAHESWKRNRKPEVMLFFNQKCYTPKSSAETHEWGKVLDFKSKFSTLGIYRHYEGETDFANRARSALLSFITNMDRQETETATQRVSVDAVADFKVVRAEGLTELPGEIVLTIAGGQSIVRQRLDVRLFANTSITNRLNGDTTDAVLVLGAPENRYVRGRIAAVNALVFEDVSLEPVGDAGVVQCRIANIRLNANALAVGTSASSNSITATVSIQPHGVVAASPLFHKTFAIAFIKRGLVFRVSTTIAGPVTPFRFTQALGVNDSLALARGNAAANLYISFFEYQPGAFKTRAEESGIGTVTAGTRLKAVFNNIPEGVSVCVTTRNTPVIGDASVKAILIPSETGNFDFTLASVPVGSVSAGGVPIQPLAIVNGTAVAVWEWVGVESPLRSQLNEAHFGIALVASPGKASLGTATINGGFAPTSTVTTATERSPIPRFVDVSTAIPAFTVEPQTHLVYPAA
jgi:hypothetical protein